VSTADSTGNGTVRRSVASETGSAVMTFAMIACAVGPVNGGSPTNIS
jgi:hypothetical protein